MSDPYMFWERPSGYSGTQTGWGRDQRYGDGRGLVQHWKEPVWREVAASELNGTLLKREVPPNRSFHLGQEGERWCGFLEWECKQRDELSRRAAVFGMLAGSLRGGCWNLEGSPFLLSPDNFSVFYTVHTCRGVGFGNQLQARSQRRKTQTPLTPQTQNQTETPMWYFQLSPSF